MTPTLLCESCGYPIHSLPTAGASPECGRAIASSLPAARPGSPWQRRIGIKSLLRTDLMAVRRPGELFRMISIHRRGADLLLAVHILIAAVLIVAPWSGTLMDDPIRSARAGHGREVLATALLVIPAQVLAVAGVLLALTLVEWRGIRFFSARRGGRLTPVAAWQVCAHASVGWVIAAAMPWLGLIIYLNLAYFGLDSRLPRASTGAPWGVMAIVGGCSLLGLLAFEGLVYAGMHACRFANPAERAPAWDRGPNGTTGLAPDGASTRSATELTSTLGTR